MTLAAFAGLVALAGAALFATLFLVLLGYTLSQVDQEEALERLKTSKVALPMKLLFRSAYGMICGGAIIGLFALIIGA